MLISINTLFIALTVILSLYAWNSPNIMQSWVMNPYHTNKYKQYYRFITSGFIHADMMHLFFNMFTLYYFGEAMESIFSQILGESVGSLVYAVFYLMGIVVSEIATFFKHRNNSYYNSLGASGGVSSVVFGAIMFLPLMDICLYAFLCMPGFIYGFLYLFYCSWAERGGHQQGINHSAHYWGAVFGVMFCTIIYPAVLPSFFQQVMSWKPF